MIENIVFDLGNVLVTFQPEKYLDEKFNHDDKKKRLNEAVFKSQEWVKLDQGLISQQEAISDICQDYPDLGKEVKMIFNDWENILLPIPGSINILVRLKEKGYPLYALSNFHLVPLKVMQKFDFWNLFKGRVISAEINSIKPTAEIYQHLLKEYQLIPAETVFIDDTEENLIGARKFGIKTIKFTNPAQLREDLRKIGVKLP